MSEIKKVKIQSIIESQIPEFLNGDNPLFKEFLEQYYISLEHQTGSIDLARNLLEYKDIDNFNSETFFNVIGTPCILTETVKSFDVDITVNTTIGFPEKYGLLKIDSEIITYKSKTDTTFEGCIRGFSAIDNINTKNFYGSLDFISTLAEEHQVNATVENLNIKFFSEIFRKFKYQFLPGFESRTFTSGVSLQNILTRAKDFYTSKGTETSYKILFKILYGEDVELIRPREYMLRPSDNKYFITKNILVEKVLGDLDPLNIKGETIYQQTENGLASASIYNIEVRPIDEKILYELSLDPESIVFDFIATQKTNILEKSLANSNNIIVDSTVGFPRTGNLLVQRKEDGFSYTINYTDKTINQFIGVSGNIVDLNIGETIIENNFAYVSQSNKTAYFRLINVINDFDYSKTSGLREGDKISLSSFGLELNNRPEFSSWIYNIPTSHKIKTITQTSNPTIWRVSFYDAVRFILNENVNLSNPDNNNDTTISAQVKTIIDNFTIEITSSTSLTGKTLLSKVVSKSNVLNYPEVNIIQSNIQNTYIDKERENFYVASSGLPNYSVLANDRKILFSTPTNPNPNSGIGLTTIINTNSKHRFYTGEKIYLTPTSNIGIDTGAYFITAIGDNSNSQLISISFSNSDIYAKKYIEIPYGSSGNFVKLDYENKTLQHQKLLRKFKLSNKELLIDNKEERTTNNRPIGLLLNGVEIYSNSVYDENIYYGKLNTIDVISGGDGYDIINTPIVSVADSIGFGAKAHLNINGYVKGIKILDIGNGYGKDIKISIYGGNGVSASIEPNVIKTKNTVGFRGDGTGVNPTSNTIIFTTPHNFDDGEEVEYLSNSNIEIEYNDPITNTIRKLPNNSFYFIGIIDDKTIKLYKTKEDAANKINEINLTLSPSSGIHYFRTLRSRYILTEVSVPNGGYGYSNKRVYIPSNSDYLTKNNGIDTYNDVIYARNHNFNDKDLVVYNTTETPIVGLNSESKYYVKVLDNNRFSLCYAGIGNSITDENYIKNKIVRLSSIGVGTHSFSFPPIGLEIKANPEVENGELKLPVLEPVVVGEIESVFVENYGEKYGVSNIINFHRRPNIIIGSITSQALLKPIVIDGKIIDVQILNYGRGYGKDIDLVVRGGGKFADLSPVVQDGKIISVNIINGGIGYNQNTVIDVVQRGSGARIFPSVSSWKINQVNKNSSFLSNVDEGILVPSKNQQPGLQFIHFYPPKVLRKILNDNITQDNKENTNPSISPIIGWSYDGFPIYGPYQSVDGEIRKIKSSYVKSIELNPNIRPTGIDYPDGFFIQDFIFDRDSGELDEYNGKFIKNVDFPNGTYAYFYTIDVDSNGNSIPQYPYVIGSEFKSSPEVENFNPFFNQDQNLNDLNIIRNVSPYYLNSTTSFYGLIDNVEEKYKQEFIVKTITKSGVDAIDVYDGGDDYKVGDILDFDNTSSKGTGLYATISSIKGKEIDNISVGVNTYYPIKFEKIGNKITGIYNKPLDFRDKSSIVISNISSPRFKFIEGRRVVDIFNKTVGITTNIQSIGSTGDITTIYPNDVSGFEVDDFIQIDNEILRIIEIKSAISAIRVHRLSNTGIHTAGISNINLLPRKFSFNLSGSKLLSPVNSTVYFNAEDVVGFGQTYTLDTNENIIIPEKTIYIPNHPFTTGQPLSYYPGFNGTSLFVKDYPSNPYFQLGVGQTVYAVNYGKDFIGISTIGYNSPVGIGSTLSSLLFDPSATGIGIAHSFTTQLNDLLGNVENYSIIVNTKEPHQLLNNDIVSLNLVPELNQSIKFRYDPIIRKITTDILEFDSTTVNVDTNDIEIFDDTLKTGDKVVYYDQSNTTIGGLVDNGTYFIIKDAPDRIKLAEYYEDAIEGKYINLTSIGSGIQGFAKINPEINITKGNYITFDLTDPSLDTFTLRLYKDKTFNKELEQYNYILNDVRYLKTSLDIYPRELYYSFCSATSLVCPDYEVYNNNSIQILGSNYTNTFNIDVIDDDTFEIDLPSKPESLEYTVDNISNITYTTKSTSPSGPIDKIKISYGGKGYIKTPKLSKIITQNGKNAIVKAKSNKIGRISSFDRIKDGFDYPTDNTLLPLLSVPAVVQVEDISRVNYVGVITGGINYNSPPSLKVIGNDNIKLRANLQGSSVISVDIIENTNDLSGPLTILPVRNSNGYGIDDITVVGDIVNLELVNSNNQIYPLITTGYGTTEINFPFNVGDDIFIERCRISDQFDGDGNILVKDNYNSSNYDYRFFKVVGVDTNNFTVSYSMAGITTNLGEYTSDFGYGYVVNRNDMAVFDMVISNDLSYTSGEKVFGYDENGTNICSARVMENGWDNDINELRLTDVQGDLKVGNKLRGSLSRLNGTITAVNIFNLQTKLDVKRDKLNDLGDRVGFLNDYQQRLSDNNYYQKFSYSIKGKVPYNIWKEPVKSTIHPSGFKEFSDLTVQSLAAANMKVGTASSLSLLVNIDNTQSLYTKNNFGMVYEDEQFEDGSIERVVFEEGTALKPYSLSTSNKVIRIDDISSQFNGTSNIGIITTKVVSFASTQLYQVGVNTDGLLVGDRIGYSTYHFYPDSTYILSIGNGYVGYSSDTPHRLNSINGVSTTITQSLNFYRRIPGDKITGITSFKLTNNNEPLFYKEFDASNGISTVVNVANNSFDIENHNFQTGQKVIYTPQYETIISIADTNVGSGAILEPVFVGTGYSVSKINVISGGSGYDPINTPQIIINGTKTPLIQGSFNPLINSGIITSIQVINPGYGYFPNPLGQIGITTTSESEGRKDIIMGVGGGIGSAIYENGYNVAISTAVSGITSAVVPNFSGQQNMFWGFNAPYIPVKSTTGAGIDAKFSVFIVYNSTTGNPISTSVILRDGGRGYSVGDTVSIAGTYMGGETPQNDLSFVVSKISNTRVLAGANQTYTNIPGNSVVGYGTGAIFNISRNSLGDISNVEVSFGGKDYELTDNISIDGSYIGGNTPLDNLYLSPIVLGTDKLPETLYIQKTNNNSFKVSGLSTGSVLDITTTGIGTHSFRNEDPNPSSLIAIDNIIQNPVYRKPLQFQLSKEVLYTDNAIYIQSGISSVALNDILQINDEYLSVKNIGIGSSNEILVERGFLGTRKVPHSITDPLYVCGGNYNIIGDVIYFATAPYGPKGLPGFEVRSSFAGRAFSRRFDSYNENDKNLIFDDVSNQFNGIGATNFILKSDGENVVGIFTNTNSITGASAGVDINNNPLILINNIPQIGGKDYVIDTPGQNTIRFISGVPLAGKITKVGYTTGFGYQPLVGASATVSVSVAGTISNVYLTGFGKGYRTAPLVSIASTVGSGATIVSTISTGGTITSLTITNPGSGYTNTILPDVRIDLPQNYYNIPLVYDTGSSGVGTGAKASVIVGNGSSIISFNLDDPGKGYKVGDVLVAPGITTIPNTVDFQPFKINVLETFTDNFSGWYPGQFIQFDDLSPFFNGRKKKFTLTITQNDVREVISLKSNPDNVNIEDNLFIIINDILQVPGVSYTFSGSRIIFKEAPKVNSKCVILFFRGSDLDVEQVDPPKTIKEGDTIQISENKNDPFDRIQFERVVKDIVSVDILDTFPYDSIGIITDPTRIRPLNWTKQTQDRIMNGSLYSKSRPNLKSKIIPTARVIKNISKTDTKIYVDSAIPLFEDIDENRNFAEDLRDIVVVDNRIITEPIVSVNVSASSSISSIDIINPGSGYENIINPQVSITDRFIEKLDPIYDWNNIGLSTTLNFNSVGFGTGFIAVGSSGLNALSYNGTNWFISNRISQQYDFNDVIGYENNYISIGSSGSVYSSIGLSTNITWNRIDLYRRSLSSLTIIYEPSTFVGKLNKGVYDPTKDILSVVGQDGYTFSSSAGLTTTRLYENRQVFSNLNSIAYNSIYFVSVGDSGDIVYTEDGIVWNVVASKITTQNLNDIIWDGYKFISIGDNSTIIISLNGINWMSISNNLIGNIVKIHFNDGVYTVIDSNGSLYYSLNLSYWKRRNVIDGVVLNDITSIGSADTSLYVSVGSTGLISYSNPIKNRATAISTTTNGSLSIISVINGGFGYTTSRNIPTIVETDACEKEQVYSIKAKGDFGIIKNVKVYPTGNLVGFGTTSPAIEFTLQSQNYDVILPTIEYTQPVIGDYFIISDSNVICGHALTGITTSLGGMSSYPLSKVGTATTFIDGIYCVENATTSSLGITTVRCLFVPIPDVGADRINVNIGINTTGFYGRYSFGIIYDYQNRARENPKSFIINKDNGLIGINSGPMVYRTRGVV